MSTCEALSDPSQEAHNCPIPTISLSSGDAAIVSVWSLEQERWLTSEEVTAMANVNITDFDSQRQHTYGNSTSGYPLTSPYGQPASHAQALRAAQYLSTGNPMMQQSHPNSGMAALAQSFGGMSLQSPYSPAGRPGSQMPAPTDYHSGVALSQAPAMYISNQQQLLYPGGHLMSGTNTAQAAAGLYTPMPSIVQSCGYPGYGQRTEASPNSQLWTPRIASDGSQGMPTLITPRRDSVSSNEEHLPGTPYTGVNTFGSYGNSVAVLDRSPSGHFTQAGTPSPSQFLPGYQMQQIGKSPAASSTPLAIQLLVQREPAIPRAIPAPSSPVKPLDRCLENKNGETNVYIRGLLPETTDEMLRNWGERFGDIVSSKAIIEHKNGLCKGFGFVKYHNFDDAENCIRGFHYLGYETSFARESFYSKLKKFADENNTNLYISNIPKNINEFELQAYFQPFKVCSSKILRDDSSNGRGVGFCRYVPFSFSPLSLLECLP